MSVVDFAYEVLEMQRRIEFLERELKHYKELHEMNYKSLKQSEDHTKEMTVLVLNSLLGTTDCETSHQKSEAHEIDIHQMSTNSMGRKK